MTTSSPGLFPEGIGGVPPSFPDVSLRPVNVLKKYGRGKVESRLNLNSPFPKSGQESARKKRRQQLCSLRAAKLKTKSCPRDTVETVSFTECEMFAHKDWLPLDLSRIVNS